MGDFTAAEMYFRKAARLHSRNGVVILQGKSLRFAARMMIRTRGDSAVCAMDTAKDIFLALGAAGEVCRSTLAIIEELLLRDASSDVRGYVHQLQDEATALGVSRTLNAVESLKAAINGDVNLEILDEIWDAFGPTSGLPAVSATSTVEN
ncbi:MAG: hypothetical protein ACXW4P_21930 [Thermoanaerobaculia bacterium]